MQDLKPIIAKNITSLRQSRKMTQIDLAEKLNYSDKAVSKWERGESVPDITVLKTIADLFEVRVDYLLEEQHAQAMPQVHETPVSVTRNHTVVTLLSELIVCFLATVCFVVIDMIWPGLKIRWLPFVYAIPAGMIVWLVFNSMWFNTRRNYLIISLLMWSVLLCATLTLYACAINAWQLLFLGIPGQAAIFIWSRYNVRRGS